LSPAHRAERTPEGAPEGAPEGVPEGKIDEAAGAPGHRSAYRVLEAGPDDDAEIRALLREGAMDGLIRLALTREPSFALGAEVEGERHRTVLLRQDGRLLGMGTRAVREVFHHGQPALLGYLGQLRAAMGGRHLRRMRDGFRLLEAAVQPDELPFDLTSIVADNAPARRLLERGLPGLPVYRPLAEAETLLMSTADPVWRRPRLPAIRPAQPGDQARIVAFLQAQLARHALAPRWTEASLRERCRDLAIEHFALLEDWGALRGVGAVWDQRGFKQAVIMGYRAWLARARPALNPVLALLGQPRLPPAGSSLAMAYLSHFATAEDDDVEGALALVQGLRSQARARGLAQLVLTLAVDHPLRAPLARRFAARPYRSVLYAVCWQSREAPDAAAQILGGRRLYLEAATL
jgi:hypothetical protein